MVDKWQVRDDNLTHTFTLRDGLKFHDAQLVRAADVVASLKRWGKRDDAYGQSLLAAAAAIEAIGDQAFRIALKAPFPVLEVLATLTSPTPFILPERLAQTDAFTQITEAVGSGPFKFVREEWQPGHRVVFVKNPLMCRATSHRAGRRVARWPRSTGSSGSTYPRRRPRRRRSPLARSITRKTCRATTRRHSRATRILWLVQMPATSGRGGSTS